MTWWQYLLAALAAWTVIAFPVAVLWGRRLARVSRGQARKTPGGDQEQHLARLAN